MTDQTSAVQHGRKEAPPIPENLKDTYLFLLNRSADNGGEWEEDDLQLVQLIERIGRLEQERNQLRATLSCVFCGEPMKNVDALKAHSATCQEHPAVKENAALEKQLTLCRAQLDSTLETADREWDDDEDVYKERDRLKAQVERMSAPVSTQEQSDAEAYPLWNHRQSEMPSCQK